MRYFKFKDKTHEWVLPVYEDSVMYAHPEQSFNWDRTIHFVSEVDESEYNKQFNPKKKLKQLEFDF